MGAGWRMARLFDRIFVATSFFLVVEIEIEKCPLLKVV
jgi:hypothetical protein